MPSSAAHRVSSGERIHVDSRPGRLEKALVKKGVRLTRQRRVLLQVMDRAERHLAADEILERAQRVDELLALVRPRSRAETPPGGNRASGPAGHAALVERGRGALLEAPG